MKFSLKNTGKVWGFSLPQIMLWILVVAACNGCYIRHKKTMLREEIMWKGRQSFGGSATVLCAQE